jgi:hypothetical protein
MNNVSWNDYVGTACARASRHIDLLELLKTLCGYLRRLVTLILQVDYSTLYLLIYYEVVYEVCKKTYNQGERKINLTGANEINIPLLSGKTGRVCSYS